MQRYQYFVHFFTQRRLTGQDESIHNETLTSACKLCSHALMVTKTTNNMGKDLKNSCSLTFEHVMWLHVGTGVESCYSLT